MPKFNYVALAFGIVFSIATTYSVNRTLDFIGSTQTADGVVIATPIGPHHPDVVFTGANGDRIEFSANGDISQNVGDRVRVRYRQDDPQHSAKLDTFGSLWGTSLVLLAMAICFVIAGVRNIAARGWGQKR